MINMNNMCRLFSITLLMCMINTSAYAYIDPGLGSILIQATIGAIAAVSLTIKIYWQKIKDFFIKRKKKDFDPK
jgi:hypothetical protein